MDILVSYCVFIYRFYWVTCTTPVIIGNWRPSKCFYWLIDLTEPVSK